MTVRFRSVRNAGFLLVLVALVPTVALAATDAETIKVFQDAGQSGQYFSKCYGFAVLPNIGKGGIGVGGAHGTGRVYEQGKVVGDVKMTQVTVGLQLGGQSYSEIIFFEDKRAFDEFTGGNFEFAAGVSAKLESGGLAVVSLRDYAPLVAERAPGHPVRVGPGTISFQVWEWDEAGRTYELAQFTLRGEGERWQTVCRRTRLRALQQAELCGALAAAGLDDVRWRAPAETGYYQPIVTARLRR